MLNQPLTPTGTPEADNYLFTNQHHRVEFTVIEEDMAQLNDFCMQFLEGTQAKISELKHQSEAGVGGSFQISEGEAIDLSDDDIRDGAAMELDVWQDTGNFLVRANCLLLLACFAEKSLVHLCNELGGKVPRPRGGQSKVDACLDYLRTECGLQFDDPKESLQVRELCRKIRNAFAHGEWDTCRELVTQASLVKAFAAVTHLLEGVEAAAEGSFSSN